MKRVIWNTAAAVTCLAMGDDGPEMGYRIQTGASQDEQRISCCAREHALTTSSVVVNRYFLVGNTLISERLGF